MDKYGTAAAADAADADADADAIVDINPGPPAACHTVPAREAGSDPIENRVVLAVLST
jgi:hypothetical protein